MCIQLGILFLSSMFREMLGTLIGASGHSLHVTFSANVVLSPFLCPILTQYFKIHIKNREVEIQ